MIQSSIHLPETFVESTLELSDLNLHFIEGGSGQPVIFLHAYSDSWYSFRLVLPLLASHFKCFVLDQRGHGKSHYAGDNFSMDAYAEDVIEFLSKKNLDRVVLVGSSMGSFIARIIALRYPERVERLVLVGCGLRTDNNELLMGLKEVLTQLPEQISSDFVEALLAPNTERGNVPDWFFQARVESGAQLPGKLWRRALEAMLLDNHSDQLDQISQPTLILGGQQDDIFNAAEQTRLAQIIPQACLKLYDDVGHYPHWERPEQFAEDVVSFLQA